MLKDLFDKGKCALGFHVGEWRYPEARSCQQTRVCSRCQTRSQQLVHAWQSWGYESTEACRMIRRCGRCAETESKIEHVWAAATYAPDGSCALIRPCSRCTETSRAGYSHLWQSWAYDVEGQCAQTIACSRCGETGTERRTVHDWSEWQPSRFYDAPVRVCRRCAEMVFRIDERGEPANGISLQMMDRAVWNLMEAQDSAGVRERLVRNQEVLLSPVAEKYFKFVIEQRSPDESTRETFRQLAALIERCRREGIDAVLGAPADPRSTAPAAPPTGVNPARARGAAAAGQSDRRFLGHWRHTEARSSGGFSMAIDTHCVLDPSGRFEWWSKSMGSFGGSTSGPENGAWSTSGDTLQLDFDDGNRLTREAVLQGATMFWPGDGRYRLWERIS